jgi:hypothetical protein
MSVRRAAERVVDRARLHYERVGDLAGGLAGRLREKAGSERGQAMMEYVLITIVCVLGLLGFSVIFQRAIKAYLLPIYFFVGLPIP